MRVAGRGFASAANRAYLAKGGGHYIHAEKLRDTNREAAAALARQGRYRAVAGNLRVKEVWVPARDAGARAERFVVCHNPGQALRDQLVRGRLVAHLEGLIDGSDAWPQRRRDELAGSLKDKPGCAGSCAAPPAGCCAPTRPRSSGKPAWTANGRAAQRSAATPGHQAIFGALDLRESPRFFDFTPSGG